MLTRGLERVREAGTPYIFGLLVVPACDRAETHS
jgi:hypothetical protein